MQSGSSMGEKWDKRFMLLAHDIAEWSKESGRRVGAVIVGPDKDVRATGFNGLPRGVNDDIPERHSRETGAKYLWSCHAERNAIYNAARAGAKVKGCSIYVPWFPCLECTKAIIQSGISRVVAYRSEEHDPKWSEEFKIAKQMLSEADVSVEYIEKIKDLPVGSVIDGKE